MKKVVKSQVSFFVIFMILIVALVAFYIYLMTSTGLINKERTDNPEELIFNCQETVTKNSLVVIGVQGGYYKKPSNYLDIGWSFIPYYYYEGKILMPDKKLIESEIADYIDENLFNCISNIKLDNFNLKYEKPRTSVNILPEKVDFNIDMLLTISKAKDVRTISLLEHHISRKSKLFDILEIAKYITESHKENSGMICADCLVKNNIETGVYSSFIDFKDNSVLVVLYTNESFDDYSFEFLNKYTDEEENE